MDTTDTTDTLELLHDDDPHDPYAWQQIGTLATALGIAERTVRSWVATGAVERILGPRGRPYYRQSRQPAEHGSGGSGSSSHEPGNATGSRTASGPAADGSSQERGNASRRQRDDLEVFALVVRDYQQRHEALATELGAARAMLDHARAEAERVRREREEVEAARAADAERVRREREELAARAAAAEVALAATRQRLEELSRAPWYALRVKRRLRRELGSSAG